MEAFAKSQSHMPKNLTSEANPKSLNPKPSHVPKNQTSEPYLYIYNARSKIPDHSDHSGADAKFLSKHTSSGFPAVGILLVEVYIVRSQITFISQKLKP